MRVLLSIPTTAPASTQFPSAFEGVGREASLSWRFAKLCPWSRTVSEHLARVYLALVLFARRRHYDAVVTGRYGEYFAILQALWPFGRKPHLLLDVEWYSNPSGKSALVSGWLHRLIAFASRRIQVFCRVEADRYSSHFGIPAEKFVWIPYCADLATPATESRDGGYIFTGGSHHRDYETLFGAVADLPVKVLVAAPHDALAGLKVPANVQMVGPVQPEEYWRLIRDSALVVLSLDPDVRRCPGIITYVKAMQMGKCVVVNEPLGAPDYIDHGHTGFIVPARDPARLRQCLQALFEDRARTIAIGVEARRESCLRHGPQAYVSALERAVEALTGRDS